MFEYRSLLIEENYLMKDLTTLRVGGVAKFYVEVKSISQLKDVFKFVEKKKLEFLVLGGGSNMVVSDNGFRGLVICMKNKGIGEVGEEEETKTIRVQAGEAWDDVVWYAVNEGLWGVENLTDVPGSVGAFAVQNVGAYGQEASEVIDLVEVFDIENKRIINFKNHECDFGYRKSIFNTSARGKYVIWSIVLKLKKGESKANLSYPSLKEYFEEKEISDPTLSEVRTAVKEIRADKLPNWEKIPNSGSFFKNLVIDEGEYDKLKQNIENNFGGVEIAKLEELRTKFVSDKGIKIPTAWLLEICSLKGKNVGGAYIYEKQPLIIINKDRQATADDVMRLFQVARKEVYIKTGMEIFQEPNLVGFSEKEIEEYFKL